MEENLKENRANEIITSKSNLKLMNALYDAFKTTCKIITSKGLGTGFFIKLEKKNSPFYCLMSNEHIIERKMIESKESIEILYENQHKTLKIILDTSKRFIQEYTFIKIDVALVEILPEDEIKEEYFALPCYDFLNGYDQFMN